MTEFITRNYGNEAFEVIIKTDSKEHYKATEDFARRLIDHEKPMTNADRIRAMSYEELAKYLMQANDCELRIPFCKWDKACDEMLDNGGIPDEMCLQCMIDWLRQPVEVGNG